tara:strand:- start:474 stop:926 length:453 start_codon:yes stop_codon:yes gene_type:complete
MKKIVKLVGLIAFWCGSSFVYANECAFDVPVGDNMTFGVTDISVPAGCSNITINLNHAGKLPANVMGHNWVLSLGQDVQGVAMAGIPAGLANNYIPAGDARVLASTKVIGGGESTSVTFSTGQLDKGTDYVYFCSFPGHFAVMRGTLRLQ